jgi:hypothetical protein
MISGEWREKWFNWMAGAQGNTGALADTATRAGARSAMMGTSWFILLSWGTFERNIPRILRQDPVSAGR